MSGTGVGRRKVGVEGRTVGRVSGLVGWLVGREEVGEGGEGEVEEVEGGGVEVVEEGEVEEVGDGWSEGGVGGERRRSQKAKLRR